GEDLDGGPPRRDGDADHIDRADLAALDRLPLRQPLDRVQPVAVARRVLEALPGRGVAHLLLEPALDRPVVPGEELDHLVDDLAVVLLRDVADARGVAALDVEVETRDAAVAARLRAFARPVAEDPVQNIQRLA